jgi:hypothetical protein
MTLSALAFPWACGATVYLLLVSSHPGIATSAVLAASGGEARRMPPSLATANGVWTAALLICVTLLAGMPLGVALAHPPGQRTTAWAAGLLLLGFCAMAGVSVGLLYLPSAILLIVAGAVGKVKPPGVPLADLRA